MLQDKSPSKNVIANVCNVDIQLVLTFKGLRSADFEAEMFHPIAKVMGRTHFPKPKNPHCDKQFVSCSIFCHSISVRLIVPQNFRVEKLAVYLRQFCMAIA